MIFKIVLPFIISFVLAYAINPVVLKLESIGLNRKFSILLIIIFFGIIISYFFISILPILYKQLFLCIGILFDVVENIDIKYNLDLGLKLDDYLKILVGYLDDISIFNVFGIFSKSFGYISMFIIGVICFIYFLLYFDSIKNYLYELIFNINKRLFDFIKIIDLEINNYIKGLGIFMIIQLIEYSFIFYIINHPNWLLIGILAAILTIIPYFGGLIVNLVAIILSSVVSSKLMIITSIICIVFPLIDQYFISPKVYGKTNEVNPLITIIVVFIFSSLFGFLGIVFALPCYLILRTTFYFFKKDLKKSINIFKEEI